MTDQDETLETTEQEESLGAFIDRMNTDPDKVRAEWEADLLEEKGPEWVEENEKYYDAWWGAVLMMHGEG